MIISAQVSLYPLRQERLSPAIQAVSDALLAAGLHPETGSMSTLVTGEADRMFAALHQAFVRAATTGQVVMTVTLSNACPVGE
ncbi:MAG TPA: YkoF family thiamine/hydroxymethylpyrimidine-binding protein [Candidatus Methylomirabilis sp.]|nr:YkoF family thiamine/hydroxymethylpyrimidine-binding protein [Candidatus Methylomirabilis sp.]